MPAIRGVFSPAYAVGGAFPAKKFALAAACLARRLPLVEPKLPPREVLLSAHEPAWLDKVERCALSPEETAAVELEVTPDVSLAHRLAAGGTLLAARDALAHGVGLHCGGGAHHAFAERGSGFCLINDLACAALTLLKEGAVSRVAVVDLDVHQGDGTASILTRESRVFTLSLHQRDIFPERKQKSSLDLEFARGTGDGEYLEALGLGLARTLSFKPELVLYQAGVDCAAGDELGGLGLTPEGLKTRDETVRDACSRLGIAVAVTLGGGYRKNIEETVALHAQTLEVFAAQS